MEIIKLGVVSFNQILNSTIPGDESKFWKFQRQDKLYCSLGTNFEQSKLRMDSSLGKNPFCLCIHVVCVEGERWVWMQCILQKYILKTLLYNGCQKYPLQWEPAYLYRFA